MRPSRSVTCSSTAAGVRHYSSREDWISFSDRRCDTPADALGHFIDAPLSPLAEGEMAYTTYGYVLLSHLLGPVDRDRQF